MDKAGINHLIQYFPNSYRCEFECVGYKKVITISSKEKKQMNCTKCSVNAVCLAMQLSGSLNMAQPKSLKTVSIQTQALSAVAVHVQAVDY